VSVTAWPRSITTDVGEIETVGVDFTVTAAFVEGVPVGVGVAPPVVPVSVSVTVRTQFEVVLVGVKVSAEAPELTNPGHPPEATDQT